MKRQLWLKSAHLLSFVEPSETCVCFFLEDNIGSKMKQAQTENRHEQGQPLQQPPRKV